MTEREQVEAFHRAFGIPVRERPEMPSEEERLLRCRLLLEETLEFIAASGCGLAIDPETRGWDVVTTHEPDLAAMAQENADVRVITHGTDLTCGFPFDVFAEVMRANMSKLGPDGKPVRREDGKVIKPPGFVPADVAGVLERHKPSPGDWNQDHLGEDQ